jgi:hypothetical protein
MLCIISGAQANAIGGPDTWVALWVSPTKGR